MKLTREDCTVYINKVKIFVNPNCKHSNCYGRGYTGTTSALLGNKPVQCHKCINWFHKNILELEKNSLEKFKEVRGLKGLNTNE